MGVVKNLAKSLMFLAVTYSSFRYVGDFSWRQSGLLMLVTWLGYGLYAHLVGSRRTENAFSPFCVAIHINWYELLSSFKLIGSMEDWRKLCEEAEKIPSTEYSVFRLGFFFTVIRPPSSGGLLPGLTYWNDRKSFANDVDFRESIIELDEEHSLPTGGLEQHPFFKHPKWSRLPEMYFKRGIDGYELGVVVHDDWWEHLCNSGQVGQLATVKADTNRLCGTTRLLIATLPCSEFSLYYEPADYDRIRERLDAREKQLETHGWKRRVERDAEIRDPWSRLEHRYFAVSHRAI